MQWKTMLWLRAMDKTAIHTRLPHLWVLAVVGALLLGRPAAAFDPACGEIPAVSSAVAEGFPAVVEVHTVGQATGTYKDRQSSDPTWHLGASAFTLKGRGFAVGQLIVTAAHVVYPSQVELRIQQDTTTASSVVMVQQLSVYIGATPDAGGVPADIVHLSHRFDLAILRPKVPLTLHTLPYYASATWWQEAGVASSLLRKGSCVVVLAAERDIHQTPLPGSQPRSGHVVAPQAVSSESSVVAGLNPNTVTISTMMLPGDSGSPVIAFDAGTPRLVGVVIATRYPYEPASYISRLDPILPILEALQEPANALLHMAHAN